MCYSVRFRHSLVKFMHVSWNRYCTHLPRIGIIVHVYSKLVAGMRSYDIVAGQGYCNLHDILTRSTNIRWQQHDQEVAIMMHHLMRVTPVLRAHNLGHDRCRFV